PVSHCLSAATCGLPSTHWRELQTPLHSPATDRSQTQKTSEAAYAEAPSQHLVSPQGKRARPHHDLCSLFPKLRPTPRLRCASTTTGRDLLPGSAGEHIRILGRSMDRCRVRPVGERQHTHGNCRSH